MLGFATILSLAFIGGITARRFGYPRIIGQLIISLLLGIPLLGEVLLDGFAKENIPMLSQLGVVMLLFLTGFEIDTKTMRKASKDAAVIALLAAIVPFMGGIAFGGFLGWDIKTSMVLGMCLAVTAEGTKSALLIELNKLKTRVGTIMLTAGILDDVFEIAFLTIILALSHTAEISRIETFPLRIAAFIGITLLAFAFVPKFIRPLERSKDGIGIFSGSLVIGLIIAIASELAGFGAIVGAFIAGLIMQKSIVKQYDREEEEKSLRMFSFAFIVPFFFAQIGLETNISSIIENPGLTLGIIAVAILGKLIGTVLAKPFTDLSLKQLVLIGWGMNSRGVMELVIAQIAVTAGLISSDLYSAIVCMTIVTTVTFPFVVKHMLKQNPTIMD